MGREVTLIFLLVIGTLSGLYHLRQVPWIGTNLLVFAALLMVYVPLLHQRVRRLSLRFFETDLRSLISSLKLFTLTGLSLFPLFLIANHFYQQLFFNRSFQWGPAPLGPPFNLASMIPLQLFLVAFPEEFFFRGWLQSFLSRSLGTIRAVLLTSAIFAVAHSLIALEWWHFAIFFPGCVFGWLKEKTGAITASVLFHAMSNLLVAWIGICYQ